jgi:hypothetical protein
MINKLSLATLATMSALALQGCNLDLGQSAAAPANRPPAADYQQALPASPPATNIRGICYTPADLATYRARMLQMELNVITLQCQGPGGARAYESQYAAFLNKFKNDLVTNTRNLNQLAGRKRFNVDSIVTEFANRTGQRAQVDKEFCARGKRAFDWALSPQVTSIAQVPPPYDIGPEMNVYPCPSP